MKGNGGRFALLAALILAVMLNGCGMLANVGKSGKSRIRKSRLSSQASSAFMGRLRAQGKYLVYPNGSRFPWRFASFFGGIALLNDGREAELVSDLRWFAENGVTGVRTFVMMDDINQPDGLIFPLPPQDGRRNLGRYLELAQEAGLYVEIVALAQTKYWTSKGFDLQGHLREVGQIAAQHENSLIEFANEPVHPTQIDGLDKKIEGWRGLVPAQVASATGISGEGYYFDKAANPNPVTFDYITVHAERNDGEGGWRVVRHVRELGDIADSFKKPVISDEPIGAADADRPGARISDPGKHFGLALVSKIAGLAGVTFHYDRGVKMDLPRNREVDCFNAWIFGATVIPFDRDLQYWNSNVNRNWPGSPVDSFNFSDSGAPNSATRAYSGTYGDEGYSVIIRKIGDPGVKFGAGWSGLREYDYYDGISVIAISRNGAPGPELPGSPTVPTDPGSSTTTTTTTTTGFQQTTTTTTGPGAPPVTTTTSTTARTTTTTTVPACFTSENACEAAFNRTIDCHPDSTGCYRPDPIPGGGSGGCVPENGSYYTGRGWTTLRECNVKAVEPQNGWPVGTVCALGTNQCWQPPKR